ncbi:RNA-directed DNA polymerase from mobile element jockey [Caerostris darwini]|uniref:RNA-directed DNA polymerase from mobile element jockey n=1 Tax=Caerostris darwini TaxID=1538125 RepID=A0AAV4S3P5_9ARAC|nr:RNA-directed DNA polymerase from mobile element jockey [Caerostris darwini]
MMPRQLSNRHQFFQPKQDWDAILSVLKTEVPLLECRYTGRFMRLQTNCDDDFRKLTKFMDDRGLDYKSYSLREERPIKVVIRGLPASTNISNILKELAEEGFELTKITRLSKYRTKEPMPLFYAQVKKNPLADAIYNVTEILGAQVCIEAYRGRPGPSQCWNCQGYFHSSEVCHLPTRCVRCAGTHKAEHCTRPSDQAPTCVNCGGDHAANWRGCPRCPGSKNKNRKLKVQKKKPHLPAPPPRPVSHEFSFANITAGQQRHAPVDTPPQPQRPPRMPVPPATYSPTVPAARVSHAPTLTSPTAAPQSAPPAQDCADLIGQLMKFTQQGMDGLVLSEAFRLCLPQLRQETEVHTRAYLIFHTYWRILATSSTN